MKSIELLNSKNIDELYLKLHTLQPINALQSVGMYSNKEETYKMDYTGIYTVDNYCAEYYYTFEYEFKKDVINGNIIFTDLNFSFTLPIVDIEIYNDEGEQIYDYIVKATIGGTTYSDTLYDFSLFDGTYIESKVNHFRTFNKPLIFNDFYDTFKICDLSYSNVTVKIRLLNIFAYRSFFHNGWRYGC